MLRRRSCRLKAEATVYFPHLQLHTPEWPLFQFFWHLVHAHGPKHPPEHARWQTPWFAEFEAERVRVHGLPWIRHDLGVGAGSHSTLHVHGE